MTWAEVVLVALFFCSLCLGRENSKLRDENARLHQANRLLSKKLEEN